MLFLVQEKVTSSQFKFHKNKNIECLLLCQVFPKYKSLQVSRANLSCFGIEASMF